MSSDKEAVLRYVYLVASNFSPSFIDNLATRLENMEKFNSLEEIVTLGNTHRSREILRSLAQACREESLDPKSIALALRTTKHAVEEICSLQEIDIVWTGPSTEVVPVRRTDQALYEVDGLSGATMTGKGVNNLMHFWFGDHGFKPFLERYRKKGGDNG